MVLILFYHVFLVVFSVMYFFSAFVAGFDRNLIGMLSVFV